MFIKAKEVLVKGILPALELLPVSMRSIEAQQLLLTIGFQESGFRTRVQDNDGPARGYWQFERTGGVVGVLKHRATKAHALMLAEERNVRPMSTKIWDALAEDDVLAAGFARLLLWTHPDPLPERNQIDLSWEYYLSTWRPGKPHKDRWPGNYFKAKNMFYMSTVK